MLVLALDTATEACVAGICEVEVCEVAGGEVAQAGSVRTLASRAPVDARRHGELLARLLAEVLAEAGARPADLEGVAVGVGPGPFTSLRVGVVTGASLADALGIRAAGVCSLDAIALGEPGQLAVATEARRREVYWARYRAGARQEGPDVGRPAQVAQQLDAAAVPRVVGSGASRYAEFFGRAADPAGPRYPSPAALVTLAWPALNAAEPPAPLVPMYLRRPDAVPLPPEPAARPASL